VSLQVVSGPTIRPRPLSASAAPGECSGTTPDAPISVPSRGVSGSRQHGQLPPGKAFWCPLLVGIGACVQGVAIHMDDRKVAKNDGTYLTMPESSGRTPDRQCMSGVRTRGRTPNEPLRVTAAIQCYGFNSLVSSRQVTGVVRRSGRSKQAAALAVGEARSHTQHSGQAPEIGRRGPRSNGLH
jgi:hypothetical protein